MDGEIELVWSPEALDQLSNIFEHIAKDNLEAAKRLVQRLEKLADALVVTPQIGRIVPEHGRQDLRERIHKISRRSRYNVRLIYRVLPGKIEIATVWHTSRQGLPEL